MAEHPPVATQPPPDGGPGAPFWSAARREELVLPFCPDCGCARWYPETRCPVCGSLTDPRWAPVTGTGTVFSWTRVHRPFVEVTATPLVLGLIEPDGGQPARIVAPLDLGGRDPRIGERVAVRFLHLDTHTVPVFVSATEENDRW